jgi:hypothetical protein
MRSPDLTVWAFCVALRGTPDDGEGAADVAPVRLSFVLPLDFGQVRKIHRELDCAYIIHRKSAMSEDRLSRRELEYLTLHLRHAVSVGEYITVELLEALLTSAASMPETETA